MIDNICRMYASLSDKWLLLECVYTGGAVAILCVVVAVLLARSPTTRTLVIGNFLLKTFPVVYLPWITEISTAGTASITSCQRAMNIFITRTVRVGSVVTTSCTRPCNVDATLMRRWSYCLWSRPVFVVGRRRE